MRLKLKTLTFIIFLILFNNASLSASNNKIQLDNVKNNVSKWMINEWNKTVAFQKEGFNKIFAWKRVLHCCYTEIPI